ncbi:aldose 1-epimerase family protein [Flavobacterium sp. GP15]|uniref:aldose 1-epimerase family protein n=1 Tax=Flavobacterium sp. GP15 TaxID=2758567 RepID=UPI00165E40AE|nr:aldose 1-epimerase family protein [Flavobacterium sp. GP15]
MTITITNSKLKAQIKTLGAELCSLKDNNAQEYMWEGDPAFWGKHSPILFPIVGTLKNDYYTINNKEYNMSRHGFAREMEFKILDQKENSVVLSLQSSEESLKVYPFLFELQIQYTLLEKNLIVDYTVFNNSSTSMPFSIGAHPAFALPNHFENYSIEFEKQDTLQYYLLENNLISDRTKSLELQNKQIDLNYELFKNDALIFKNIQSKSLTIIDNKKPRLKVCFQDFPDLGIWTKPNAPFICIEPWFGYSDTNKSSGKLDEKEGIQILNASETFKSKFSIQIF